MHTATASKNVSPVEHRAPHTPYSSDITVLIFALATVVIHLILGNRYGLRRLPAGNTVFWAPFTSAVWNFDPRLSILRQGRDGNRRSADRLDGARNGRQTRSAISCRCRCSAILPRRRRADAVRCLRLPRMGHDGIFRRPPSENR